ncbi:hypothetical protein YC2023_025471 [Brassica napus]
MALYALRRKFRFKHSRSSAEGMVLRCVSAACNWRVYAIKFKNVDKYEIRKLSSYHSCSVDDRAGALASAYAKDILPITNNTNGVTIEGEEASLHIFPPVTRRPPGRPRKSRILSTGEIRLHILNETPKRLTQGSYNKSGRKCELQHAKQTTYTQRCID